MKRTPKCPACGGVDVLPVVYGYPSPEMFDRDDLVLGGCMVTSEDPAYACRNPDCEYRFGLSLQFSW